jgi:hypothetical protein
MVHPFSKNALSPISIRGHAKQLQNVIYGVSPVCLRRVSGVSQVRLACGLRPTLEGQSIYIASRSSGNCMRAAESAEPLGTLGATSYGMIGCVGEYR